MRSVQLSVVGADAAHRKRGPSSANLKVHKEARAEVSFPKEERATANDIRNYINYEYKMKNHCPVVQGALRKISNIRVFKERVTISFSQNDDYSIPKNILDIISRDIHSRFFKDNRQYLVQCVLLKGH